MGGSALLSIKGVFATDSASVSGGLERPKRLLFSASSLRNASNSRSNLLEHLKSVYKEGNERWGCTHLRPKTSM